MKKTSFFVFLLLFTYIGCSFAPENELRVILRAEGEPVINADIYVGEKFSIDNKGFSKRAKTDENGEAVISGMPDNMYEIWVAKPGFATLKQHLPLRHGVGIELRASLEKRKLPRTLERLALIGSFNRWNSNAPLEMEEETSGDWSVTMPESEDTLFYKIMINKNYQLFYDPGTAYSVWQPQSPPYVSFLAPDDDRKVTFPVGDFARDTIPFLNQWVERQIVGDAYSEYVLLEKMLSDHYDALTRGLQMQQRLISASDEDSAKSIQKQLDELLLSREMEGFLNDLYDFSETTQGEIMDLAKLHLAQIYWLLGKPNKAQLIADEIDLESFAGGEAYTMLTYQLQLLPGGMTELTRSKLATMENPYTRYVMYGVVMRGYEMQKAWDKLEKINMEVMAEFPGSSLAVSADTLLQKMHRRNDVDSQAIQPDQKIDTGKVSIKKENSG
jgi:hypothetical protein